MTERIVAHEGFLRRWARMKSRNIETESRTDVVPAAEPVVPAPVAAPEPERLPTMDDVAQLTGDSDFSAFVARGVDAAVRRTALKKLFADPHFNAMDGLDVYIDDYTKPSPVTEAMLASLEHAKQVFGRAIDAVDALDDGPDEPNP